jgi:hypothetical protein
LNKLKSEQSLTRGHDNEEFWNKLKISYEYLDKQHQNMFLKFFFFGWFETKYYLLNVEWRLFKPKV